MPRCGNGHDSATADYCDVCGVPFSSGTSGGGSGGGAPAAAAPAPESQTCGSCGQPMLSGARFCELCGWDAEAASLGGDPMPPPPDPLPDTLSAVPSSPPTPSTVPPPPAPTGAWQVVAVADRAYFDTVLAMEGADAPGLTFPVYWPERRFPLTGEQVVIGRRSTTRGTDPDIDLGGQNGDPGVSHVHAMLVNQQDGGWAVVDLGSSNGTYVNDSPDPIEPNQPVPFTEADKIHLGAWTTLSLHPG